MLAGALVPGAEPVLANYIPVIDHPLFLGGLGVFFIGVALFCIQSLLPAKSGRTGILPPDAIIAIRACLVAILLACITWVATQQWLPAGMDTWAYYEFSAWGAGHTLQTANVCLMLAIWLWGFSRLTGQSVLGPRTAGTLFTLLVAPHFLLPLIAFFPSWQGYYISGSTQLMRWGIFPMVLIVLALSLRHARKYRSGEKTPLSRAVTAGLTSSIGLTLLGFILGAMIRGSSTLIPAHYHASLGGITLALMLAAYLIASAVSRKDGRGELTPRYWKTARWQMLVFGIGQAVFALGFGIGGLYGLGRKTYAGDQVVRSAGELFGLGVMGIGGLMATVAGVLFLILILRQITLWWGRGASAGNLNLKSN